ncbi:hypothetical protein [Halorussus caseinilyticus]|uniref:Uncharacterized protein n=1 Tax=Halorussus caseinilyticus TaxID=3034025 RepID=A0ABD5WNX7_9EURY|nr:hypothetical protein [Halorussus sp. DT72]
MNWPVRKDASTAAAIRVGISVGVGVLALYLVTGFVVARWDLADFSTRLTLEMVGAFLLLGALTVATFAIPITAYVRFHVVAPVVILGVVLLGWVGYAVVTGILASEAVFGLGLYAIGLSPLYVVCYAVAGGLEYYVRKRVAS